jgi:stage V sporulation protein B
MRHSYLKNAAVLTAADVALRLAGMGFRIYLANALGGEGMGLYQLVLAVYGLFTTLATSGVAVAATRLLAEELERSPARAHGMLHRLLAAALALGTAALAAQFGLAGVAARWWLGDVRAAPALRAAAFGLPFMALAAVLRGFFVARRRVGPNVCSQMVEQPARILAVCVLLARMPQADAGTRCAVVLGCGAASEALSAALMVLFYRGEARRCFGAAPAEAPEQPGRRLWAILWPVEGGRCVSSALHTAENMLVPACLTVYLAAEGGRSAAVTQYGNLKGMALPLLTFPFGLLGSLAVLLMPEITAAHAAHRTARLRELLGRMLDLTLYLSAFVGAAFCLWGGEVAALLYSGASSAEAGFYLRVLGPVMPFLYLESIVDGAMKGIGEQKASFRYSVWDSILRIVGVVVLLPRFGIRGFLLVIALSAVYTCVANTRRLVRAAGLKLDVARQFGGPTAAALAAALVGQGLRLALQAVPLRLTGRWGAAARLALGGVGMAAVYWAVAWPLGLGRALGRQNAAGKPAKRGKIGAKAASAASARK